MSDPNAPVTPPPVAEPKPAPLSDAKKAAPPARILLVSYPKIVFLYPTFLLAIIAGIWMKVTTGTDPETGAYELETGAFMVNLIFLMVFAVNLVILSFDFPRATSLTVFFALAAVGIGLWFVFHSNPGWFPVVENIIGKLHPWANSTFYFLFACLLGLIYLGVLVSIKFDYWEVRPNELLHHHGFLSDLERLPAPNLRIDKEINDVFEYWLLRSGRLILHPSNERRAIVLENVLRINRKEDELTRMLGTLQVHMRPDSDQ